MEKKQSVVKGGTKTIEIPRIKKERVRITIVGLSPLMVNNFSEKSRKEIDDKQQKKAAKARDGRNPAKEYDAAFYHMSKKGKYGMPAAGLRNAAVSACRFVEGVSMTVAKGCLFVLEQENGLVEIKGKPTMDERIVRVGTFGNKKPMTRYRPRWDKWECTFEVLYASDTISSEQLLNLFDKAGFHVGLCEYRPEKSGNCGMFEVKRS